MDDKSFGPRLLGHFDFTLLFEHTIFHIVPSALILFATPFYIHTIFRGTAIIRSGLLLGGKLAFATALIGVQVANLVLWWANSLEHLDVELGRIAAILSLFSAVCIAVIVFSGHVYFLHSSTFLGLYLTITLPPDIVTTMTYYHRIGLEEIARLNIAVPALKLAILILEEVSKRQLIHSQRLRDSLASESLAGFWNKSLLIWLNPLLLFGFRHRISRNSLPPLASQFASDILYGEFKDTWEARIDKTSKFALAKACFAAIPWPFIYVFLPRLLVTGFSFAQPFLLRDVVDEVSTNEPSSDIQKGLMVATAIIYLSISIARSWYGYSKNQLRISVRAILASAVYHKSLKLSASELNKSAAITLINTDLKCVDQLVELGYESCAYVLEIGLGIAMLAKLVGTATIFALIPTIFTTVLMTFVAKKTLTTRRVWNEKIETRVANTSNILAQAKDVKMMGLAPYFAKDLQEQFEAETRAAMIDRDYFTASLTLSAFGSSVTPVLVIAGSMFWSRASEPMTASRFFTTLAFVQLVSSPLALFLEYLPYWTTGFSALSRIQRYLTLPELKDPREFVLNTNDVSEKSTPPGGEASSRVQDQRVRAILFAVEMLYVCVTSDFAGPILRGVCVGVPFGYIAMIFGPVGCGKTTMLNAILGEVTLANGDLKLASKSIAYCGQTPFLRNTTLRNNIIGLLVFDLSKYTRVIHICALDVDFAELPAGDQTIAGSGGCNLSGGQKSRIALARALYFEADIMLLDDVFSALDRETASAVRLRLFSDSDMVQARRSTIIMTTSTKQHLVDADLLYRIDANGEVERAPLDFRELSPDTIIERMHVQASSLSKEAVDRTGEPPSVKTNDDILDDPCDTKSGDVSLYSYFVWPAGIRKLLLWAALLVIAAIGEQMPQIFGRLWMEKDPTNRLYYIGYALFGIANPLLHIVSIGGFYHLVNEKAVNALHWSLADTTSRATFEFLMEEDANFLLNRFSIDISMATQTLPQTIIPVVWCGLSVMINVGVIAAGASYASPIIPCFLLVVYLIQRFYLRTSRQLRAMELDNSKLLSRHLAETSAGIEHIRTFQWQESLILEFHEILDLTQKPFYFLYSINQWLRSVMDLSTAVCAVSIVGLALKFKSTASAASMGLSLLSLISFSEVAAIFVRYFVNMEMAFGAVARIRAFARRTPTEPEHDSDSPEIAEDWPPSGKVDLNCVNAIYKPNTENAHQAFKNVSITVQPGETLGIVGRSGSGKSSLLLAILHLMEYTGSISIDNREIKTVPRDLLRARITTITQAGLELKGSVRFNIAPFRFGSRPLGVPFPTDSILIDILHRVGLWNLVMEAGGLDATMAKLELSKGQKQLFQLARAMVHKQVMRSKIVIIDEGTASMDEQTEGRATSLINEVFAGCTKIIISHRPIILATANAILRMDRGFSTVTRFDRQGGESESGSERERLWVGSD